MICLICPAATPYHHQYYALHNMADDKPRATLPRLRVTSHSFADLSQNSGANVTQRTVSLSTSMLSTPSNNIRRVQQQMQTQSKAQPKAYSKPKPRGEDVRVSGMALTANALKKLLNLQQLKKAYTKLRPFALRKPMNLSKYDYSVFTRPRGTADDDTDLPPPLKQSQIRAWESAEKISANIIFDNGQPGTMSEGLGIFDDGDTSIDDDSVGETSIDRGTPASPTKSRPTVLSIPGYTKGELGVILENFDRLKSAKTAVDVGEYEEAERNALWIYRQQQSVAQERAFKQQHSVAGKRKLQVFHKREFLHKLFGYSNNINQDHITSNSSYSAYDNVANAQKAFHEDKEEIMGLLEEDKAFEHEMKDVRERLFASPDKPVVEHELDHLGLVDMTAAWLTLSYDREVHMDSDRDDADQELVACTMGYLKQCVKGLREPEAL